MPASGPTHSFPAGGRAHGGVSGCALVDVQGPQEAVQAECSGSNSGEEFRGREPRLRPGPGGATLSETSDCQSLADGDGSCSARQLRCRREQRQPPQPQSQLGELWALRAPGDGPHGAPVTILEKRQLLKDTVSLKLQIS